MILPSDAKYLTLALYVEALQDPGVVGAQGPCVCSVQEVERTSALYVQIFIDSDKRRSRHIFFNEAITDEATAMRLLTSDRHLPSEDCALPMQIHKAFHTLHPVAIYSDISGWLRICANVLQLSLWPSDTQA